MKKIVPYIVGGIAAIVIGIAVVIRFGALWLIPLFILAGTILFWRYWHGWFRFVPTYIGILCVVIIGAYNIHGQLGQKSEARVTTVESLATQNAKIKKPSAGSLITPANTTSPNMADVQNEELTKMQSELEKMKVDMAELQIKKSVERRAEEDTNDNAAGAPTPMGELGGILPEGVKDGEEGSLPTEANLCWYSHIHEMTCRFFIMNKDQQVHTMDVMDSQGSTYGNDESKHFDVWRFGGAIRFAGGDDRMALIHNVKNDILATFVEPIGGVTSVSFLLNISGMDARNHSFTFSNIPVRDIYQ